MATWWLGAFFTLVVMGILTYLHILNRNAHKRVYFSKIRLLEQVLKTQKKRSRFEKWLIYAIRSLVVLIFGGVLTFLLWSQDSESQTGPKDPVVLYLDNSKSASAGYKNATFLQWFATWADAIVQSKPEDQRFILCTNDQPLAQMQQVLNKQEILEKISQLRISEDRENISGIAQGILQQISYQPIEFYCFSDLQKSQHNIGEFPSVDFPVFWLRFSHNSRPNAYISQLENADPITIPGEPNRYAFRVSNASEDSLKSLAVTWKTNGKLKHKWNVALGAKQSKQIEYTASITPEELSLHEVFIEDNSLLFDNKASIGTQALDNISILVLANQATPRIPWNTLFPSPIFDVNVYSQYKEIPPEEVLSHDLFVIKGNISESKLREAVEQRVVAGKSCILLPSGPEISSFNALSFLDLKQSPTPLEARDYAESHPLVQTVLQRKPPYFPPFKLEHILTTRREIYPTFPLISFPNRNAALSITQVREASCLLIHGDIAVSNTYKHPFFAPILQNFAFSVVPVWPLSLPKEEYITLIVPNGAPAELLTLVTSEDSNSKSVAPKESAWQIPGRSIENGVTVFQGKQPVARIGIFPNSQESLLESYTEAEWELLQEQHSNWNSLEDSELELLNTPLSSSLGSEKKNKIPSILLYLVVIAIILEMAYLIWKNRRNFSTNPENSAA